MTASTRSDLLFATLASAATYGLAGTVPAAVVGVVALVASFGVSAPLSALRDAAGALWRSVRGGVSSVPSMRGAEVGLRWLLVVFMAGLLVGRGGIAIPRITLPDIDLPTITWPTVSPDDTPEPEPAPVVEKPTAATYVYEKDQHAVPGYVLSAFNKINRGGQIVATLLEADPQDGTGEVPDQYKAPLAAAKEAGLPALVVTAGGKVLSVVKDTKDEQTVLDSVK